MGGKLALHRFKMQKVLTMIVTVSHSVVIFCAEVGSLCYLELCDESTLTWQEKCKE